MRHKKHLLLFFLICLVNAVSFGQNFFEEGRKEYFASNYPRAIELLTKAIVNDQEVAQSLMFRGASKIFLNQFDNAFTDLESARQIDSTIPRLDFYYGKIYLLKDDFDRAIAYYSRDIALNPRDAVAYNERSAAKGYKNDYKGALADANAAIAIDSTQDYFYADRGYIWIELKQYEKAFKDFNRSLKIAPNQKAYANRGLAYSLINQHQKAIEDYTRSLKINPKDEEVLYYRGVSYKALGKRTEACADLKKSSEMGYSESNAILKEMKCAQ